jgi:hypothetical protein
MLSKTKTKSLFNDKYLSGTKKKVADIRKNSIKSARVRISAIRINNKKYFRIDLPRHNPLQKKYIKFNLNTMSRPNYKNGSREMYRMVNGLCQYCGHNEYIGKITFSQKGYALTDICCAECNKKQP